MGVGWGWVWVWRNSSKHDESRAPQPLSTTTPPVLQRAHGGYDLSVKRSTRTQPSLCTAHAWYAHVARTRVLYPPLFAAVRVDAVSASGMIVLVLRETEQETLKRRANAQSITVPPRHEEQRCHNTKQVGGQSDTSSTCPLEASKSDGFRCRGSGSTSTSDSCRGSGRHDWMRDVLCPICWSHCGSDQFLISPFLLLMAFPCERGSLLSVLYNIMKLDLRVNQYSFGH